MNRRQRLAGFLHQSSALSIAWLLLFAPAFCHAQFLIANDASAQSALGKAAAASSSENAWKKKFPISREDIVVAMPVDQKHLTVAHASRVWRKGVRTFVAGNTPAPDALVQEGKLHNETWSYYPDDLPLRSYYGGDTRAALVPYLAHEAFGDSYKWLLYGDDDTIWFMESVMNLLQDFDPDLPYFITDHLWWSSTRNHATHPNPEAPRCLPCEFDDSQFNQSLKPFNAPKGCPCTAQLLCETDERGLFNQYCDIPKAPKSTYSMHGGAGGIISIGMLRAVSLEYMEKCVKSLYSTGGDAFISICTWQAGYAITDPGFSFYHPKVGMFDPGQEDRFGTLMKLSRALDDRCDDTCQTQLSHLITLHVRSRAFPTLEDAAQFIKGVIALYDVYVESQHLWASQAAVKAAAAGASAAAAEADSQALSGKVAQAGEGSNDLASQASASSAVNASQQATARNAQQVMQGRQAIDAKDAAAALTLQNAAAAAVASKANYH